MKRFRILLSVVLCWSFFRSNQCFAFDDFNSAPEPPESTCSVESEIVTAEIYPERSDFTDVSESQNTLVTSNGISSGVSDNEEGLDDSNMRPEEGISFNDNTSFLGNLNAYYLAWTVMNFQMTNGYKEPAYSIPVSLSEEVRQYITDNYELINSPDMSTMVLNDVAALQMGFSNTTTDLDYLASVILPIWKESSKLSVSSSDMLVNCLNSKNQPDKDPGLTSLIILRVIELTFIAAVAIAVAFLMHRHFCSLQKELEQIRRHSLMLIGSSSNHCCDTLISKLEDKMGEVDPVVVQQSEMSLEELGPSFLSAESDDVSEVLLSTGMVDTKNVESPSEVGNEKWEEPVVLKHSEETNESALNLKPNGSVLSVTLSDLLTAQEHPKNEV